MRKIAAALLLTMILAGSASALEVAGVSPEPSVKVNGNVLRLNGHGLRKKLFIKVYAGSLYSAKPLATTAAAMQDGGDKLLRMNFLHSRVEKEKITGAFREGFANNAPELAGSSDAAFFLSLFTTDFKRGDVVDLILGADGVVSASHNGRPLGSVPSARLGRGVLAIYLGDKPADEGLKKGMLGKK